MDISQKLRNCAAQLFDRLEYQVLYNFIVRDL